MSPFFASLVVFMALQAPLSVAADSYAPSSAVEKHDHPTHDDHASALEPHADHEAYDGHDTAIGVPAGRISQIVNGKRAITADIAMRLACYFGTSPDVWLHLQTRYDLEIAQIEYGERIEREVKVLDLSDNLTTSTAV